MIYTEVGIRIKSGFKKVVLTQKLVLDLNRDSDDLHRCWFLDLNWDSRNSAHTEFGFRLKTGFTRKKMLTPKFPLQVASKRKLSMLALSNQLPRL